MRKHWIMAGLAALTLGSCQSGKKEKAAAATTSATAAETPVTATPDPGKDSAAIRNLVSSFYQWYDKGYQALYNYKLYSSPKKNGGPPYRINWTEVERYQQYLRQAAPQLSTGFFETQRQFLQSCDSAFQVDREDEIPYGFDYDWYTNSQEEPAYLLEQLDKPGAWRIAVNGDGATVDIRGSYDDGTRQVEQTILKLDLRREAGSWKIIKIGGE